MEKATKEEPSSKVECEREREKHNNSEKFSEKKEFLVIELPKQK